MNKYIEKVDKTARDSLGKLRSANNAMKRAERLLSEANASHDERRILHAKSHFADCQDEFKTARKEAESALDSLRFVKSEAVNAGVVATAANPDDVDANGLELLKSGICRPADMDSLAKKYAGNMTMLRLIGSYAAEAAKNEQNLTSRVAFSSVASECDYQTNPARDGDGIDTMLDIFKRCINDIPLIEKYDELTYPLTGHKPEGEE